MKTTPKAYNFRTVKTDEHGNITDEKSECVVLSYRQIKHLTILARLISKKYDEKIENKTCFIYNGHHDDMRKAGHTQTYSLVFDGVSE